MVDDTEDPFGSDVAYCKLGEKIFGRVYDPVVASNKAMEFWKEGKLEEAAKVLKLVVDHSPNSDIYYKLGFVLVENSKYRRGY